MKRPASQRRYFVTGTDTGVGKTFVSVALATRAVHEGKRVFAFKPVETGTDTTSTTLGDDQRLLTQAAGGWQTGHLRGLYQFKLPAAPLVAAQAEQRTINLDTIDEVLAEGSVAADLVIVEGAGGWRVPITETVDMGAFAKRLGFPVLVVARAGLGTINHSLLTVEAVERQGCSVAALVLNIRPEDDAAFAESNAEQIRRAWPGRVVTSPFHVEH